MRVTAIFEWQCYHAVIGVHLGNIIQIIPTKSIQIRSVCHIVNIVNMINNISVEPILIHAAASTLRIMKHFFAKNLYFEQQKSAGS